MGIHALLKSFQDQRIHLFIHSTVIEHLLRHHPSVWEHHISPPWLWQTWSCDLLWPMKFEQKWLHAILSRGFRAISWFYHHTSPPTLAPHPLPQIQHFPSCSFRLNPGIKRMWSREPQATCTIIENKPLLLQPLSLVLIIQHNPAKTDRYSHCVNASWDAVFGTS